MKTLEDVLLILAICTISPILILYYLSWRKIKTQCSECKRISFWKICGGNVRYVVMCSCDNRFIVR